MRKLNRLQNFVYMTGAVLVLLGAAFFPIGKEWAFYIYTVGAFCFSAMQLYAAYEGDNWTIRRLRRQQIIGSLCLMLTAVAMAMNVFHFGFAQRNEWMVMLTVACVFEVYTAFRIPAEMEKERNK